MNTNEDIFNELKELGSTLPEIVGNANVFQVPENYFDQFPTLTLLKANGQDSKQTVPENYFDSLSSQILQKIKSGVDTDIDDCLEEDDHSTLLSGIDNKNPFAVPAGYFETLPQSILSAAKKDSQAKVIHMRRMSPAVRYLVAAAFAGMVGFSLFTMFTNNKPAAVSTAVMTQANTIINDGSFEAELSKLSAGDIENYLESTGHDPDAAVAASAINDNNLPDELDYLLNENTLNDFLNKKTMAN